MRWSLLLPLLLAAPTALAADRAVTDAAGRTVAVPEAPQRIVVLHEPLLGIPILDLGLPLAGSYGRTDAGDAMTAVDFIATVLGDAAPPPPPGIGAIGQIDLEKLRALRPDLIIGTERDLDKIEQLSAVAPVYLQRSSTGAAYGFGAEAELAELLGREAVFARRRDAYLGRVETIRAGLPVDPRTQTYLAIIVHDEINLVGEMSGAIQAIEDLGYRRAPLGDTGAASGLGSIFSVPMSAEIFGRINPDLLVIMSSYASTDRSPQAVRDSLDIVLPGWERFLKPAREGRVLYLDPGLVATPSVASAEHTLDAFAAWAAAR